MNDKFPEQECTPVHPRLAVTIGLNEALILRQTYFLLKHANGGRVIDGEKWIWNTVADWHTMHFPYLSIRTIRRAIERLEGMKLLLSCQPDGRMSRKKYYRINWPVFDSVIEKSRSVQIGHIETAKMASSHSAKTATSLTETTAETTGTETTRNEEMSACFGKQACIFDFEVPTSEMVNAYVQEKLPKRTDIQTDAIRVWFYGHQQRGWKTTRGLRIKRWRAALDAYIALYKAPSADTLSDADLHAHADEIGMDERQYEQYLRYGNREKWRMKNLLTGKQEPIRDLKAHLEAWQAGIEP